MNGHIFKCFQKQGDRKQFVKTLGEYAKKKVKYPEDLAPLFGDTLALPTLNMPEELSENVNKMETLIWNEEIKGYIKRNREL